MASTTDLVRIHYHRLPDRRDEYVQHVLERTATCIVTFVEQTPGTTLRLGRQIVLEPDSPAIWFTFPGAWHDIGLFHRRDGSFTGTYANVITPVRFLSPGAWETTDLFLDVWLDLGGRVTVLDEDELARALAAGAVEPALAGRARAEVRTITDAVVRGTWPPAIVGAWSLERARAALR